MKRVTRLLYLVGFVAMALATPAAQSPNAVGQISGIASIPGKGTLAGATVQLRDLTTKQVIATAKTNASGQFVLLVDRAGSFIVEILDEEGNVVGTTAPIVLAPGAMIVSAVSVSPTARRGTAAAVGAAAASADQGESAQSGAIGAIAGGGVSGSLFMPTLPSVSSAATGSGVSAGTVPSRGTASPSR